MNGGQSPHDVKAYNILIKEIVADALKLYNSTTTTKAYKKGVHFLLLGSIDYMNRCGS